MNGSETLIVPAQSDTEAAFVYQRADGTVERANSAAEAFNLCPVLREMAQENPEQANILLELAAVGKEKMEKKKAEEEEPETKEKPEDRQRENTGIKEPASIAKLEQLARPEQPNQVIEIAEVEPQESSKPAEIITTYRVEQVVHRMPLEIADNESNGSLQSTQPESFQSAREVSKAEENEQAPQPQKISQGEDKAEVKDDPEPVEINLQSELRNAFPQTHEEDTTEQIEAISLVQSKTLDTNKNQVENYFKVPTLEPEVFTYIEDPEIEVALDEVENFSEDSEIAELAAAYYIPDIDNEAPVLYEAELYTDEQLEGLFGPETAETYKELLALIESDEIEPLAIEEVVEVQADVSFELTETDAREHSFNKFEAFLAEQPAIEEPITLETIQEQADEQPLEQTLLQLTELLSSDAEVAPGPGQAELYQLLREIEAELPACYYISQETEEPKLRITPELTEKLLDLLRHLGYEHPKEALADLVKQYGLAFLLQALRYMCQLNSEYERRECVTASTFTSNNDDENTRLRIGKALFGLISKLNFEPASSTTS